MEEPRTRQWGCLLNMIIFLYMWAIISDLFSKNNYKVNAYIIDDIATLITIWLLPIVVLVILLRDPKVKKKLLDHKKVFLALALLFLAGISQRLLSIVYGTITPATTGMGNLFRNEPSIARNNFAILQTSVLLIKFTGLAFAFSLAMREFNIASFQFRDKKSLLILIALAGFFVFLWQDIELLLPYWGY